MAEEGAGRKMKNQENCGKIFEKESNSGVLQQNQWINKGNIVAQ